MGLMEPKVTKSGGVREVIGPIITPDGAAWFKCPYCGIHASDRDELLECPECESIMEAASPLERGR